MSCWRPWNTLLQISNNVGGNDARAVGEITLQRGRLSTAKRVSIGRMSLEGKVVLMARNLGGSATVAD
jgi:hypothetical protein